jgi:hypothetical protein
MDVLWGRDRGILVFTDSSRCMVKGDMGCEICECFLKTMASIVMIIIIIIHDGSLGR